MKKFFSEHSRTVLLIFVTVVSFVLIATCSVLLAQFVTGQEDEIKKNGGLRSSETAAHLKAAVATYQQTKIDSLILSLIAPEPQTLDAFLDRVRDVRENTQEDMQVKYKYVRFFKDDEEFNLDGTLFDQRTEYKAVYNLKDTDTIVCAGIFYDYRYQLALVAYVAPLQMKEYKSPYADSVVFLVPLNDVVVLSDHLSDASFSDARLAVAISQEGEALQILHDDHTTGIDLHNNLYDYLRVQINDKSTIDSITNLISAGSSGSFTIRLNGELSVVTISGLRADNADPFAILAIYPAEVIYSSWGTLFTTVLSTLVILSIVLFVVLLSNIISHRITVHKIQAANDTNNRIGCPTRQKFERVSDDIISRNPATNFAVVVIDMKHFDYISEQLGNESVTQVLLHLKLLYSRLLKIDETYGYIGNGRFVLLLHYRDTEVLSGRLRTVTALASNYNERFPTGYHLSLYGGIYQLERKMTDSVDKMINLAIDAEEASNFPYDFGTFRYYNEALHASNVLREYIEVHMESALQNNEFQVFYQPKYNINNDRPDGCEALVRWYNPEKDEYMQPGVFLPLFEANRFVVKLDKFVYETVCQYIEDATDHGQDLYPVSVNVSRITAMERDFVSSYIAIKQKHNIADGFLTIEFTESFAYEDYDSLREIVNLLHQNGFKCSIDDFGTGFSSYNLLKELPMDEIKLDRFFLDRGISSDRDLRILSSVISLARDLNMKVTQEGVETGDQLELLKKLGCHVIQGYHYSKPLRLSDYITFLSKKSHTDAFVSRL